MAQSPMIVSLQDLNTGQVTREAVTGGVGISGGRVVFRGTDSERGEEVWIVDGGVAKPAAEIRPGPKSEWMQGHFTPAELADPAIGGINADSDGDGVTNGLEFLFGRHPRNQEAEAGTTFSGGPQPSGARRAVFSFIRTATLTPGTVLEIDESADLSYWWTVVQKNTDNPWNAFHPNATIDEQTQPDGRIKTTITIDEWLSEPRFLRLRMTVP